MKQFSLNLRFFLLKIVDWNEAAFETVIKFYVHEHLGKSELGEMERREDEHH